MISKNAKLRKGHSKRGLAFFVFLGVLALLTLGFLVDAAFIINKKRAELSDQISSLEKELREMKEKKAQYESGILKAQTDEFREEKRREQGYKKPGESVFVVVPPEAIKQQEIEKEKSWWQKLLEGLGF